MTPGRVVPEHELLLHLTGVRGAATTAELLAAARRSRASPDVLRTLERLPDRRWASAEEAAGAVGTGWEGDGGPGDDRVGAAARREDGAAAP